MEVDTGTRLQIRLLLVQTGPASSAVLRCCWLFVSVHSCSFFWTCFCVFCFTVLLLLHRAIGTDRGRLGSDQLWHEGGREKPDRPGEVLWPLQLWEVGGGVNLQEVHVELLLLAGLICSNRSFYFPSKQPDFLLIRFSGLHRLSCRISEHHSMDFSDATE